MSKKFTATLSLLFFATVFAVLTAFAAVSEEYQRKKPPEAGKKAEWVVNDPYRVVVRVDPGSVKRHQTPVGVEINFDEILRARSIKGRLDRNSIRLVRFDPASGQALPYQEGSSSYAVPYQLSHDFFYKDAGKIWWRIRDEKDSHFYLYFDLLGGSGVREEPKTLALVGAGDNFHFNSGSAGILDVSMSSAIRYADWDGDGKKDFLASR